MNKNLKSILEQVPPDYYHIGIRSNIFQFIWHTNKFLNFKKLTKNKSFENVLDIGCAGGLFTYQISKHLPSAKIAGIDLYKEAIDYAKNKYPNIKFIKGDAHKLPFKDDIFDLVVSYETIEHVEDPLRFLKEMRRVLKKNGVAILTMDSGSLLFRIVWWVWENSKGSVWKGAHLHPFHHVELEDIIKSAKFKINKKHFSHLGMEVSFLLTK